MVSFVVNRDGTRAKFDLSRIERAIEKSLHACTGKDDKIGEVLKGGGSIFAISNVLRNKVHEILDKLAPNRLITVELIQDIVERVLMQEEYYVTAKAYILYRETHARQRRKMIQSQLESGSYQAQAFTVTKRDGSQQSMSEDKIFKRIRRECEREPPLNVEPMPVAKVVMTGLYDKVSTSDLDRLTIAVAKDMVMEHPDYASLAARIAISGHHKNTDFRKRKNIGSKIHTQISYLSDCMYNNRDKNSESAPLIKKELYSFILKHQDEINSAIDYKKDFNIDLFGFQTLSRSYLTKTKPPHFERREMIERPQDMFMRVALGIHCTKPNKWTNVFSRRSEYEIREGKTINDGAIAKNMSEKRSSFKPDLKAALETYRYMSEGYFIHATPTLIYSGTRHPCLSSCFLLAIDDDSIDGIYKTLWDCAKISKNAGGIGFHIHKIRANQSYIRGTGGEGDGVVPMLQVYNSTATYVNQGGKRKGAFAVYLAIWHADIEDFLRLKLPHGDENKRARDLFYCAWRNDYFMECVLEDRDWYLMCPDECPGLSEVYGEDFVELYESYIYQGKYRKVVKARDIYNLCLKARAESGVPYIGEKDSINRKSNQSNLGVIQSSNLCVEINLYSDPCETGTCNLASIALPKFLVQTEDGTYTFDHKHLHRVTGIVTRNINKVIDRNLYPTREAARSNYRHRPIGIGVQGLADVFMRMRIPYDSHEAVRLDKEIFETIYHGALTASHQLALEEGCYSSFRFGEGSKLSQGLFQFDLWADYEHSGRWDWDSLREKIVQDGIRNSMLIAPMPTASTSQILGNTEAFEPVKSNIYKRKTSSGEFVILNKYLYEDIERLGLSMQSIKNKIDEADGSIQDIDEFPAEIKKLYVTAWEMDQKWIIDHCAARHRYVDQSCSMNLYLKTVEPNVLAELDFYAWQSGLKAQYYTHSKSATKAKQHLRADEDPSTSTTSKQAEILEEEGQFCTMEEGCLMCGS